MTQMRTYGNSDVDNDLLAACEGVVGYVDTEADAFVDAYPESRQWELPIETMIAYDDSVKVTTDGVNIDIVEDWRTDPDTVCDHIVAALAKRADTDGKRDAILDTASVRITGYDPGELYDVGQYSPIDVQERVIHLRGQVTRRSTRKIRDEIIVYECGRCGTKTHVPQDGETITEPHECSKCERNGPFVEVSSKTESRNFQVTRIQTLPEEADGAESESLDVQLHDDLVGELLPGDRAIITVEVRTRRSDPKSRVKNLYGYARSIEKLSSDHTDVDVAPYEDDIRAIARGEHPDYNEPYPVVVESVAPFHEGNETEREAIAYQLFSGIEKETPGGSWMRGNSHVLLIGDPGTGKTAIIRYAANLVPRSEYATGKASSRAGLTASAIQDDFADGGWTLQAGALVRANNGLAVIDELDKMDDDDVEGMVEALSEQQVTVSMVASGILPARCSVLAAANPKHGSFNPNADVADQLDLDSTILSRFDLKFLMVDEPDEQVDAAVAETMTDNARIGQKLAAGEDLTDEDMETIDAPIGVEMFRAYVALGRQCYPVFTDDAHARVVSEYVDLRQLNDAADAPIPSTGRQVEAIHRLSEAAARIRLGDSVTESDVERALDIVYASLESLGIDPQTGAYDANRFDTGTTKTTHDERKAIQSIIESHCDGPDPDDAADVELVREEALVFMDERTFETHLQKLQYENGDVIEPKTGKLRNND